MGRKRIDLTGNVFGKLTVVEYAGYVKEKSMWRCKCECGGETVVAASHLKKEKNGTRSCGCLAKKEELTGQVFGKLTVIEYVGLDEAKKQAVWKCRCECGNEVSVRKPSLKSGHTRSCGCIRKETSNRVDIVGEVFGRLTVIEYMGLDEEKKVSMWKCKCECGRETVVRKPSLKAGHTKSCGCLQTDHRKQMNRKHGLYKHPAYSSWSHMRRRCNNPKDTYFYHYGGRGIKVCDEWNESFEAFYRDMGDSYKKGLTLERKDVNGDYTPENCIWADRTEQMNNRTVTRYITVFGETMSVSQAARKFNINRNTLNYRLNHGFSDEDAVTLPIKDVGQEKEK
ncbi:helix-turn-helix domain-containing protein [Priestia megaterium]|uniref:helix-turn-helix domain-containing protein n=1 Tax=Priestia megaterium TaxID=1404 RepID=UPI003EE3DEFE